MDLSKILAISGKNGLFKVVSQSKTGLIVESLSDGKKLPVFASDRSSSLDDISIFTYSEDLPLKVILLRIFEKEEGKPALDAKSKPEELKAYFEGIVPEYDKERVYQSDIKKLISWYNLLVEKDLISKPEAEEALSDEEGAETKSDKEEKTDKIKPTPVSNTTRKATAQKKQGQIGTAKRKTMQKK
jgi:hypothetical protein